MQKLVTRALTLALVCMLALAIGLFSVAAANAIPGDVDKDGELTIFDVMLVLRSVLNDTNLENTDVNGDGKTSLTDVIRIIKLVASGEKPEVGEEDKTSTEVVVENGTVKEAVAIKGDKVSAAVPEGVAVENGTTSLTLSVTAMDNSNGNITTSETEDSASYDVHIDGVAKDNTVAITVDLGAILPVGQNFGTVSLYHVENGETVKMTQVMTVAELDEHNEFYYYPATGNVYVALATFSEILLVNDTVNEWQGNFDYTWYKKDKTDYTIANADQLAAFGAIIGGMNGYEADSFKGKTVKLVANVDLGDYENANPEVLFYPLGYYNTYGGYERVSGVDVTSGYANFEGTFDGNGNTVENFYQSTWEMFGDYNDGYSGKPNYSRDGMGLFGRVYGGTVKNLTVKNFSSDGEYATTGVIAAYADCAATFENITIFNCNPRVYNIGNGGIVGCVGWYTKDETTTPVTFRNITVDNSNKISALWGSYDVACGGIVGQYYPTSGQTSAGNPQNAGVHFENCHVSAIMDVYNDVCANYQYYAYRYTGMLIGSVRENVTVDGHAYPNMNGITASESTVHYGDWNDYYYCELVANSLASYTHDHQFSRLTQVASVDAENLTVTTLGGDVTAIPAGRVNYVVVNGSHATENATCYHFVDGVAWNHADAGEEVVNGETVLVENNQHVYLEFNNLVTGYGWGVTSKGVGDLEGVTILDREVPNSVTKFESVANATYFAGTTVTIGDLFKFVDNGVEIKVENVMVAVSPANKNSTAGGTYVANTTDWEKGTLTFTGSGEATITVQDYYFCTPTVIEIEVVKPEFEVAFDHDSATAGKQNNVGTYLYRVGNKNSVSIGALFGEKGGAVNIPAVNVTFETVSGNASGTYTSASNWTKGSIRFSGTGVVNVTVSAEGVDSLSLNLEVVAANNITSASSSNGTDVVLLNNVKIASDGTVHYTNCTVYGNGFTFDVRGGMNMYNSKQGHGIIMLTGATLDNLVIVGDIYDTYGAYSNQEDYTSVIDATNATIQNCHISNCSAPVRANGITISDTTLYGGTVANIIISGGVNTLTNVTTVNYNDGRGVTGFGIVVSDGASETAKLVLNGDLKQYNFVRKADSDLIKDSIAQNLYNSMFNSEYSKYQFTTDSGVFVNTGILSLTTTFDRSDITDNTNCGYVGQSVSYSGASGYLYSIPASGNVVDTNYLAENDTHKSTVQGDYLPTFSFNLGDQVISNDGDGDERYLYGDSKAVYALYKEFETPISIDLTSLATVSKYGTEQYSVSASCKDANGNVIGTNGTVTLSVAGDYVLAFEIVDDDFYGAQGEKLDREKAYIFEVPLNLAVKKADVKNAVITVNNTSLSGTYEAKKGLLQTEGYYLYFYPLSADAITVTDYDASGAAQTVNLTSNIASTSIEYVSDTQGAWGGATITITYNDNRVLTVVLGTASGLNSPGSGTGGKTVTFNTSDGKLKSDGYVAAASAVAGTWPITSYSFKGNNGSTVKNTTAVTVNFTKPSSGSCVTAETLITLADGTQKRIDEVEYTDELLVWNFFEGKYDAAPASIIFYHGHKVFEILALEFDDGTVLEVINDHGLFNVESNAFVWLNVANVEDYVGQTFVGTDNAPVKLVGYSVSERYTGCYCIQTAEYNTYVAQGMLSLTKPEFEGWFDYFEIGEGMKYDEEKMNADIEKYGLYTYDDFAEYVTYEQFIAFNGPYLKVLVGRGVLTYDDILDLIASYVNPTK